MINEIIVFSEQGNPRKVKTWSNVPYFLVTNFEERGIKVHTVNLDIEDVPQKIIRRVWNTLHKRFFNKYFFKYNRTLLYRTSAESKIKKALAKFPNAQLYIFTTFSFSAAKYSNKPSILFCDWTIDHHIQYYLNRHPFKLERLAIKAQNEIIESAAFVFVLFPGVAAIMKEQFRNKNITYNGNVVNNMILSTNALVASKSQNKRLLFVGSKKYLKGANDLIEAFVLLKSHFPNLKLDMIGVTNDDIEFIPEGVICHGYLDKGDENNARSYYHLLENASVFINTTPKWGAFSASLEAMYFYTPIIVTPYFEFVATFGAIINFGSYYNQEESSLKCTIETILNSQTYDQMCYNAFNVVQEHNWNGYVDRMLRQLSPLIING